MSMGKSRWWTALYWEGGIATSDGPSTYTMTYDEPVDYDQADVDAEFNLTDNNVCFWLEPTDDPQLAIENWEINR